MYKCKGRLGSAKRGSCKESGIQKMLEVETKESRQRYIEAKREAKKVVKRARNKEWNDLGRKLEADTQGGAEEIFVKMNLKKLDETLTKWEMKMNWKKTEAMKVGKERGHCCVEIGDRRLESVEVVKHLGVMISGDGKDGGRDQE